MASQLHAYYLRTSSLAILRLVRILRALWSRDPGRIETGLLYSTLDVKSVNLIVRRNQVPTRENKMWTYIEAILAVMGAVTALGILMLGIGWWSVRAGDGPPHPRPPEPGKSSTRYVVLALAILLIGAVACLWFVPAPQPDPLQCEANPPFYLRGTVKDCSMMPTDATH